jgi:16S rRNA A1518/A1519 N6-dimethyltransferase RsmA/KsgA/DIM1 with predicted DNA glycosylase/AP lyase activity
VAKSPDGFVSLKSLKQGPASSRDTLESIRRIYFKTTRKTIENDFAHAIELLKSLESEEEREKATAYMHGISELRKEWLPKKAKAPKK